jgi:hypothetical protein
MKLQENIDRMKSMMGLIGEGVDRLTNKLIDKFSKKFNYNIMPNPNIEQLDQGNYYVMSYRKNKNTIEVLDNYFSDVFSEAGLPKNVYEKIRKDLIIGIIKNSEMEPNDDTIICVKGNSFNTKCLDTFYYGGDGFNDDEEKKIEIVFIPLDKGHFYVNYLINYKFGFIEIDGYLKPYNTGRGDDYEFHPDINNDDDNEAQEYYDENYEDIEQEILDKFYKTNPSQK